MNNESRPNCMYNDKDNQGQTENYGSAREIENGLK